MNGLKFIHLYLLLKVALLICFTRRGIK